jgi:hypothetical protein
LLDRQIASESVRRSHTGTSVQVTLQTNCQSYVMTACSNCQAEAPQPHFEDNGTYLTFTYGIHQAATVTATSLLAIAGKVIRGTGTGVDGEAMWHVYVTQGGVSLFDRQAAIGPYTPPQDPALGNFTVAVPAGSQVTVEWRATSSATSGGGSLTNTHSAACTTNVSGSVSIR